jgi:hypothetical protein
MIFYSVSLFPGQYVPATSQIYKYYNLHAVYFWIVHPCYTANLLHIGHKKKYTVMQHCKSDRCEQEPENFFFITVLTGTVARDFAFFFTELPITSAFFMQPLVFPFQKRWLLRLKSNETFPLPFYENVYWFAVLLKSLGSNLIGRKGFHKPIMLSQKGFSKPLIALRKGFQKSCKRC